MLGRVQLHQDTIGVGDFDEQTEVALSHSGMTDPEAIEMFDPLVERELGSDLQGDEAESSQRGDTLGIEVQADGRHIRVVSEHGPDEATLFLEVENDPESEHVPVPVPAGDDIGDRDSHMVDALERRPRSIVHVPSLSYRSLTRVDHGSKR